MLRSKLVGMMDTVVAGVTEGRLVCGAKHRCLFFATNVALDLHRELSLSELRSSQSNSTGREERRWGGLKFGGEGREMINIRLAPHEWLNW